MISSAAAEAQSENSKTIRYLVNSPISPFSVFRA